MRFRSLTLFGASVLLPFAFAGTHQTNPAEVPVPQGGWESRHAEKVAAIAKEKFDLLMIGDSITHNFEKAEYQPAWQQYIAPRHAIDLGYSGARTENILWNLQNGELEGQSPKAVTLMIGTNNADERNYPTHHTAEQIAGGIEAIVKLLREKLPNTEILLLGCFPYGEKPSENSRGQVLIHTNEIIRKFARQRHVHYLDISKIFLNPDGSMNKTLMPDVLHPSPEGATLWLKTMDPELTRLMGKRKS